MTKINAEILLIFFLAFNKQEILGLFDFWIFKDLLNSLASLATEATGADTKHWDEGLTSQETGMSGKVPVCAMVREISQVHQETQHLKLGT